MDLTNRTELKNLLQKYNAGPEKRLGQHFLLSKRALRQIIGAADISKGDIIVEIGPGLGTLTQELAKTGAEIIAMEKDPMMIKILSETVSDYKNVHVVNADARKINWGDLSTIYPQIQVGHTHGVRSARQFKYKIVANLPYNIGNFLIRSWLETKKQPEIIVVMVQKEVAKRICSKPPHMNLLAASVQVFADTEIINYVPAEVFWPKPKVDSAILSLKPRETKLVIDSKKFFEIVKAGFSQPRKQLVGNLVKRLKISREKILGIFGGLNISEKVRAENLNIEKWIRLLKEIKQIKT